VVRHLIVTFDIRGARPGDRRYSDVDAFLQTKGALHKAFKQVRLLTTRSNPQPLARQVSQIIGPLGSVMISKAARPYRFVLGNRNPHAARRPVMEKWFRDA
jgi:hypothetical protein